MLKRYSIILIVILIWLLQNSFAGISFGGCCQQKGEICNCLKDQTISCSRISESYCDVTCVKEVPVTSSFDKSNTDRASRSVNIDTTGIILILHSPFLVTSNNCPEYINVVIKPYLYSGQSHYRSPPVIK